MKVTVKINLLESDKNQFKQVFNKEDTQLEELFHTILNSYVNELKSIVCEGRYNSAPKDILADKIFYLLDEGLVELFSEHVVAKVFKIDSTKAKSVLIHAIARHRTELSDLIDNTLKDIIEKAEQKENDHDMMILTIQSAVKIHLLKDLIIELDPGLQSISKARASAAKYTMPIDTYDKLKTYFKI